MKRSAGVLLPIFSLDSSYGIGTCGKKAYDFVDFLAKGKQSYWQILPLNPLCFGNSPYSSTCTFAGNPLLIDLDMLAEKEFLYKNEYEYIDFGSDDSRVNYNKLYNEKNKLLELAASRFYDSLENDKFGKKEEYNIFKKEHKAYLDDYALYQVLKKNNNGKEWGEWEDKFKYRNREAIIKFEKENEKEIEFQKIIQYFFYYQYYKLKKYANEKGIKIIGDIPIYVSYNSVEVWTNPKLFQLDENLIPTAISGCPPDGYNPNGQVWNTPLYDYDLMEKDNYSWWVGRLEYMSNLYDVIRIDHFRAFASYFSIDGITKDAKKGVWIKGPGMKLLSIVNNKIGADRIIAEDLGLITDDVKQLLNDTKYPGMKVFLFGFNKNDEDNIYRPHNFSKNSVAYIGTHDNDTLMGWFKEGNQEEVNFMKEYMHIKNDEYVNTQVIRQLYESRSKLVIVSVQDILGLDNSARMNIPGTVGDNNWSWRLKTGMLNDGCADFLAYLCKLYSR